MRLLWMPVLTCCTMLPLGAAEAPLNTLTPEESAQGWILFFDGETTFGWRVQGEATVADGALVVGGTQASTIAPATELADFETRLEFRTEGNAPVQVFVECGGEGEARPILTPPGQWLSGTIRADGGYIRGEMLLPNGQTFAEEGAFPWVGRIRFTFQVPPGTKLFLRNVKVRPLRLKPLFNGKDLTGWKEVAGQRAQFRVTPEGELNAQGGRGELQTEEQWDDFVLQCDVLVKGTPGDGGIGLRCLPGQLGSGYEVQIRNEWEGTDRTKPVEFGTGGLFGHQKARKVVSTNNEWFTTTIVAHDNHLAVWVNGYPVSDFNDERLPSEDARRGRKTTKGPVSLQIQDANTSLTFRNIRLAPLPK